MIDITRTLEKIVPGTDGPGETYLRKMVVAAINPDNTADLTSGGVTIPAVPVLAGAQIAVAANVQVLSQRGALLVLGKVGAGVAPPVTWPMAYFTLGSPSLTNGVELILTPSAVPVNVGGMWTSGTNFTIPAGQGGLYEMGLGIRFTGQPNPSSGQRQARFNVNGSNFTYTAGTGTGLNDTGAPGMAVVRRVMAAGDVVTFGAFQVSGGALTLNSSSHGWLERKA